MQKNTFFGALLKFLELNFFRKKLEPLYSEKKGGGGAPSKCSKKYCRENPLISMICYSIGHNYFLNPALIFIQDGIFYVQGKAITTISVCTFILFILFYRILSTHLPVRAITYNWFPVRIDLCKYAYHTHVLCMPKYHTK